MEFDDLPEVAHKAIQDALVLIALDQEIDPPARFGGTA